LRTDIYSLGATMYESLVGDTPFDGSTHFEIMTKHLSEAPKRPSSLGIEIPAAVEEALMRSLAKRAGDRWESARDMRKLLESALREGDVGLVETQRLGRHELAELRPVPTPDPRVAARPATARSLADELEPGTANATVPKRRRKKRGLTWLWATLAILVLGGGGGALAVKLLNAKSSGYDSVAKIDGVALVAGQRFGKLLVETDGKVTPKEVYDQYSKTVDELLAFEPKVAVKLDVLDHIVVLPQSFLCKPALFPGDLPKDCATAKSEATFGKADNAHMLLVSDDRPALREAMKAGLASAVCVFQPADLAIDQVDKICAMTKRFAPSEAAPRD
jgi:hypothetical protein